jgi:hypothetical protein
MAAPDFFIKSLLRIAISQGRDVLEAIVMGQFSTIQDRGGKMITSLSANGKSFSFQVDPKLSTSQIMGMVEEALEYFDGSTLDEIQEYLSTKPIRKTRIRF